MSVDPPKRRLRKGSVAKATAAELHERGVDPETSAAGAAAMRLATEMDSATEAKDAATAARELRQAMAVVRALAEPKSRGDTVDELTARREERLA